MARRPRPPLPPSRYSDRYDTPGDRDRYDRDRPERDGADRDRSPRGKALNSPKSGSIWSSTTLAILGAALVIGIAMGALFGSSVNFSDETVATRVAIDESVANPEICAQYGAGAIAVDLRAFVTLNPFKVFISQPLMQPGCVLRSNNWSILEQRDLVTSQDVQQCKRRMNTFGYIGDLDQTAGTPVVECVYENDGARNLFLKSGAARRGENSF